MFLIESFPYSVAQESKGNFFNNNNFHFTHTINIDEEKMYKKLDNKLLSLEKSKEENIKDLETIMNSTDNLRFLLDEKEELQIRIDWLKTLYTAKAQIKTVDTKEKAKNLRELILSVQTCPLKKRLLTELDTIEQSYLIENGNSAELPLIDGLIEKAIEEIGTDFINLGNEGRRYVVAEAISLHGEDVDVKKIEDLTLLLETRVTTLKDIEDLTKAINYLQELPIHLFSVLSTERKEAIAKLLLENKTWSGLASLARLIIQYNNRLLSERSPLNTSATMQLDTINSNQEVIKFG